MKSRWVGDPDKYAELAKPFASQEEAERVVGEFVNAVRRLREQYRIPELIVQLQVYITMDDGVHGMAGGAGWGDQSKQAQLAKSAADLEFDSLMLLIENLVHRIPQARQMLITDPEVATSGIDAPKRKD